MSRDSLNFKVILLFFLPLIVMTEMHQITHSVIYAFLARLSDPTTAIAAFSIAFAFNATIATINNTAVTAGISFITDRTAFWQLFRFYGCVSIILFMVMELIIWTPMGEILFGQLMNASEGVVKQARVTAAIMGLTAFAACIRNLCYAQVMSQRRTVLITKATVIRLISLAVFLFIYSFWLDGAAMGGAAMVSGMAVEAIYMVVASYPSLQRLDKKRAEPPSYGEIWRFSWPLMIAQSSERGITLAMNFFLGQLSNPDLALAGFGVVQGLVNTFLAPCRNLIHCAQTFVVSIKSLRLMFRFTLIMVLFFVSFMVVLFLSPLRELILEGIMGLHMELKRYVVPGIQLAFMVAIFWGSSAFLRGVLSAMRRTGDIAATVPIRFAAVVFVCSVTLFFPDTNGTVMGVLAISAAFASDSLFLALRLRHHYKTAAHLFPNSDIADTV